MSFPKWLTRLSISQIWNTFKFLVHKSHSQKHNNNRGSADEHKTAFVCFIRKGTNMTIISECFENINQTGHVKTLTHQTLWCYWDRCGMQHSVCAPNVHPSFTSSTHTNTQVKVDTTSFYLPNLPVHRKNLWPTATPLLHPFAFFQNVWMIICFAAKHSC